MKDQRTHVHVYQEQTEGSCYKCRFRYKTVAEMIIGFAVTMRDLASGKEEPIEKEALITVHPAAQSRNAK